MELAECDYCFPPVPNSPSRRLHLSIHRSSITFDRPSPLTLPPPPPPAMLSALTPNTAAFLEYISPHADDAPTSLPPAALFNNMPVPGRDTPEDTPPSAPSTNDSQLNEHSAHDDDDGSHTPDILQGQVDDADSKDSLTGNGTNKRKAGRPSAVVDDDEDG